MHRLVYHYNYPYTVFDKEENRLASLRKQAACGSFLFTGSGSAAEEMERFSENLLLSHSVGLIENIEFTVNDPFVTVRRDGIYHIEYGFFNYGPDVPSPSDHSVSLCLSLNDVNNMEPGPQSCQPVGPDYFLGPDCIQRIPLFLKLYAADSLSLKAISDKLISEDGKQAATKVSAYLSLFLV